MLLTLVNLTSNSIIISRPLSGGYCSRPQQIDDTAEVSTISPSQNQDVKIEGSWNKHISLKPLEQSGQQARAESHGASKEWSINPESLLVRVSLAFGASWQILNIPQDCPWRIYCSRVRDTVAGAVRKELIP